MNNAQAINARQIRAARALLDWSQDDLALAACLSVATIRKLELGHISPRNGTASSLRHAFESHGLEFLGADGVRGRQHDVIHYQGIEGAMKFIHDMYETAACRGDSLHVVGDILSSIDFEPRRHTKNSITIKCLMSDTCLSTPADGCEVRLISKNYIDSGAFFVCGDKYSVVLDDKINSFRVVTIQSFSVAQSFKRQFNSMWEKAMQLRPEQLNGSKLAVVR